MSKKKALGVNALSAALAEKENTPVAEARVSSNKPISSPMNSPSMVSPSHRIQRMYLDLPVSKESVECELQELDPTACVASPLNKRVQSLLSEDDPTIRQLKQSVLEEGQRDPVLARPLKGEAGRYEIVYGTRRRFVSELIAAEHGKAFTLKAWVSPRITDADAKRLADSENEDREAISAWETARYFAAFKKANPRLNLEAIAALEGVDTSKVSRYLKLSELPEELVRLVRTPTAISLRAGLDIARAIASLSKSEYGKLASKLSDAAPYDTALDLQKAIKAALARPAPVLANKQRKIEIANSAGEKRAVIGAHRSQKGQYKIDLFDINDAQLHEIQKFLAKALQ